MIWLRSLLVLVVLLALLLLQSIGRSSSPLSALLWLSALLLPSLLTLLTHRARAQRHTPLFALELSLDIALFTGLLQGFGGAGNPLSFYLLLPALLGALTLPRHYAGGISLLALCGYFVSMSWYQMPAMNSPLHALTHQHSSLHSMGMAAVFVALLAVLSLLGQVIQRLVDSRQRQQEHAMDLAGRREHMYRIAATLADQAHEINTPLGTLVMLADNLQQDPDLPTSLEPDIAQLAALANTVAHKLRTGANASLPPALPLSELLQHLRQHLRHLAPTLHLQSSLHADPIVQQPEAWFRILSNLGYNAIDAGATELAIEMPASATQSTIPSATLTVSDNGPAHSDTEREGMGMGLILVHTTLEHLGGELTMTFDEQWTTAHITLPIKATQATDDNHRSEP